MIQHTFTITNETKDLVSHRAIAAGGLRLVRSKWLAGYSFVTVYHYDCPVSDLTSKHVVVAGSFVESSGAISTKEAGYVTSEDTTVIPAGTYTRTSPNGGEIWCIRSTNPEKPRVDHVRVEKLSAGETASIQVGEYFLVAEGRCTVGSQELVEEKPYLVESAPKTLTATGACYVFVWADASSQ